MARAIEQLLPGYPLLYFGDTARTPYGTKSADVIIDYSLRNGEFLLEKGAAILVIGCNSASSVATERLRTEFDVPVLEVIGPAARKAASVSTSGRIGIIGTRATVRSNAYCDAIETISSECRVFSVACPLLVPLVEEGWTNRRETKMIIRRYLHPLKEQQIDTLILGCTHYPLLAELIQARAGKRVRLIDSSIEAAWALKKIIEEDIPDLKTATQTQNRFYLSDITESACRIGEKIFGHSLEFELP